MTRRATLIVMAKAPRIGSGKSRLARDVGRVAAWGINRRLHRHTLEVAVDPRWRTVLAVAPASAVRLRIPGVWPGAGARTPQGQGDLGARLRRALRGVRGRVAVIGVDCPGLRRADIAHAFAALGRAACALGPAADGGFWIAAARRADVLSRAFNDVRWSTAHAFGDVALRLPGHARLRELADVDTLEDWRAFRDLLRAGRHGRARLVHRPVDRRAA